MIDLCWIASTVPKGIIEKSINVQRLINAKNKIKTDIAYTAILAKAFALVAKDIPELRQVYASFPIPGIYQSDGNAVTIMVACILNGEEIVLPLLIKNPETRKLTEIAALIRHANNANVESVPHFARILHLSKYPFIIRRLLWLLGFCVARQRMNYFGTIGITTVGRDGALITTPVSPCTTTLSYGPFGPTGDVRFSLAFDHRVYDGAIAVRSSKS